MNLSSTVVLCCMWCWSAYYVALLSSCCLCICFVKADSSVESENNNYRNDDRSENKVSSSKEFGWLQENFPNPNIDAALCRSSGKSSIDINVNGNSNSNSNTNSKEKVEQYHRLCDPDSVLSDSEIQSLELLLTQERSFLHRCHAGSGASSGGLGMVRQVEFGVVVVHKMDLRPYRRHSNLEERVSESFARSVHDAWGVGVETACGGTGVLIFLSILDRAIYISRGGAIEEFVTNSRIDRIINGIKPQLRSGDYYTALRMCVDEISNYIVNVGPPTLCEQVMDLLPLFVVMAGVLFIIWKAYDDSRQARLYAHVSSQLNEIDRARAEALQGRYRTTSCPICLENFKMDEQGKPKMGSDNQPIKLLRCGHIFDESCWAEWVNSGQGDITKCPICQQDISGEHAANTTKIDTDNLHQRRSQNHPQHHATDSNSTNDEGSHQQQQQLERRANNQTTTTTSVDVIHLRRHSFT